MRQHPILSALPEQHVLGLLADEASTEQTYGAGDVIIRQGDIGDSLFLIGSGSVEALLSNSRGQTIGLSTMLSGEMFGEMGLFARRPRSSHSA